MRAFVLPLVLLGAHEADALAPSLARKRVHIAGHRHVTTRAVVDDELEQGYGVDGMQDLLGTARGAPIGEHGPSNLAAASAGRRQWLSRVAATASVAALTTLGAPDAALATIGPESDWPLWTALPVAPYSKRKTIRIEAVKNKVWTFDQIIGIYYGGLRW